MMKMKRPAFVCVTQLSVEPEADTAIKHSEKPYVELQDLTPVASCVRDRSCVRFGPDNENKEGEMS